MQEPYDALRDLIDEWILGNPFHVFYFEDSSGNPALAVTGNYSIVKDNPFTPFADFVDEYDPEVEISSTAEGILFKFVFDADEYDAEPPEPEENYKRTSHYGVESQHVNECSNCRENVSSLPLPPIRLVYPAEAGFSQPTVEHHYLCVTCSPGHYDDVVRGVDYFGVENNSVTRIVVQEHNGEFDNDAVEWDDWEEIDNPFIETTIDTIESLLLE